VTSNDPTELKAKSRISVERKDVLVERDPRQHTANKPLKTTNRWVARLRQPLSQKSGPSFTLNDLITTATLKSRLPSLIIAALLFFILVTILTTVSPSSVANIVLYQSYLPVLFIFMLAAYFLAKAIFIATRISIFSSLFFTLLLFLKFQSVELSFLVVLIPLLFFAAIELVLKLVIRK
jgi:hypothetical protein